MKQLDPKLLRKAFGSYMTGVTVITAINDDGQPVGFTANSFTSVSLEPPLLLVCPSKFLSSFDVFANCQNFAVNILSEDQQSISNIFAGSKDDRFAQVDWHIDDYGNPILAGTLTHFSCKTHQTIEAGDHHLLIGEVLDFASREGHGLGYASGGYFSLGLEREAAEISVQQTHVHVGVIVEHEGKVLLCTQDGKASLPSVVCDDNDNTNAVSAIEQFLIQQGIQAQLGAVFSIYENSKTHNNYIFYRASASAPDTQGIGEYVPLSELPTLDFATPAMQSMMSRYVTESKNGLYGVYVGQETTGKVH
ncbi:flavin reductase [Psychrobacter aestuarii]|uniref:Flavin reductase n=1 Tax=Psychrobacter aestuarii TaxID=556327 RepID=A0ABP3FDI2_9GAMM|nr:flavin reductase family protein [Psychrobacter aestuarii]